MPQPCAVVDALQTEHNRSAHQRNPPCVRAHARVGGEKTRSDSEVERDFERRTDREVRIAVAHGRGTGRTVPRSRQAFAPIGHAQAEDVGAVVRRRDGCRSRNRVVLRNPHRAERRAHRGGNILLEREMPVLFKHEKMPEFAEKAVDVRRTAGTVEHFHPLGNRQMLPLLYRNSNLAPVFGERDFQRVFVEERLAVKRDRGKKRVVQHPLRNRPVARTVVDFPHPAGEQHQRNGGATLVVGGAVG